MQSVQFRLQCLPFRFVASCTSTSRFPIFPEAALRYPILCWRCVGHFSLDGIIMSHPHHIHIISSYSLCVGPSTNWLKAGHHEAHKRADTHMILAFASHCFPKQDCPVANLWPINNWQNKHDPVLRRTSESCEKHHFFSLVSSSALMLFLPPQTLVLKGPA